MNRPKTKRIFERETHTGVMQDKSALLVNRSASGQGYRFPDEMRLNNKAVQPDFHMTHQEVPQAHQDSPKTHPKDKLVPLTTHVPLFNPSCYLYGI